MPFQWYWYAGLGAALLVLVFVVTLLRGDGTQEKREKMPYRRRQAFLSQTQQNLYELLRAALRGRGVTIFPKAALGELVYLPKEAENAQEWYNQLQGKQVDFVICDATGTRVLLAILLEEAGEQGRRIKRDRFGEQALNQAGVPFLRVPVDYAHNVSDVVLRVDELLALQAGQN